METELTKDMHARKNAVSLDNPEDFGLEIKDTASMGKGVFATKDFKRGDKLCPFKYLEKDKMGISEYRDIYGWDNSYTYISYRHHWIITTRFNRNIVSYINERKDNPNVKLIRLMLIASQDIIAGEELFLKYWYKTTFSTHK
jgi:hypothetical protein